MLKMVRLVPPILTLIILIILYYAFSRERKAAQLEVDLLKTLKHPNIVGYHDSFDNSDGNLMIVMAFCEGGDLNRYLRQKQDFLDEQNLVEWLVQICMALQVP